MTQKKYESIKVGDTFGYLRVTSLPVPFPDRLHRCECECACGSRSTPTVYGLLSGKSSSCGCKRHIHKIRHGMSRSPEWSAWANMRQRCNNPADPQFKDYGGRGISVCARWVNSFVNFYEDMGARPTKRHSIDRIDNNGNYEPENCRWSTRSQQNNNTRRNRYIIVDGRRLTKQEYLRLGGFV